MRTSEMESRGDKRKFPRISFGFPVEEAAGRSLWMTENVSLGGCFLRAAESRPVGSGIDLSFRLPGSQQNVRVFGEVRHVQENGMGIAFIRMDTVSRVETERFVRDYFHAVEALW